MLTPFLVENVSQVSKCPNCATSLIYLTALYHVIQEGDKESPSQQQSKFIVFKKQ